MDRHILRYLTQNYFLLNREDDEDPGYPTPGWQTQSSSTGHTPEQQPQASGQATSQHIRAPPVTPQQTLPASYLDLPQLPFNNDSGYLPVQESYSEFTPESSIQGQADLGTQHLQAIASSQNAQSLQDTETWQDSPQGELATWPSQEAEGPMGSPKLEVQNLIIGIGGCIHSGKSTLASHLKLLLQRNAKDENRVVVISQDAYLRPAEHCPFTTQSGTNVRHKDCLQAVDWVSLLDDVSRVAAGNSVPDPSGNKFTTVSCSIDLGRMMEKADREYSDFRRSGQGGRNNWAQHFYCHDQEDDNAMHCPAQLIIVEGSLMSTEYNNASLPVAYPPLAHYLRQQQSAYESLRRMMHLTLCLHIPKAEAKRRRFESLEYKDHDQGG
ncbi:hypothetical protein LZ30DRAFT_698904 [Colletotrichum cereale]|nr:hypothetical protein LZ30DRAFT_698904 [Colletotrichum cereale]